MKETILDARCPFCGEEVKLNNHDRCRDVAFIWYKILSLSRDATK